MANEHIVRFEAGYDCIKFKCRHGSKRCFPNSGGSHGKHGLNIRFVSKGDKGAVQFVIYSGWEPQYKEKEIGSRLIDSWGGEMMPADLGYHSKTPMWEGQEPIEDSCEFCDGQPCYYDGSGLNAYNAMYALVNGGDEAIWKYLDAYYEATFNGGEYQEPQEYCMPLR